MDDKNKINSIVIDDTVYETQLTRKYQNRKFYSKPDPKKITAFIPGIVRNLNVKRGQNIKEGEQLLILEAMKMKNILYSHCDGKIKDIKVQSGDMVLKDQLLIEIE